MIEQDGDIYGDGVNVAARLEQLADPGGIFLSAKVYEEVRDKLPYTFDDRGDQQIKNIARSYKDLQPLALREASAPVELSRSGARRERPVFYSERA